MLDTQTKDTYPSRRHKWKPGQSGNPTGLSRRHNDIEALAREHGPEAIETVAAIMRDVTSNPSVRLAAATALLDRGFGRPKQTVDATVNINLAEEHLAALNALTDAATAVVAVVARDQDQTLMLDVTPDPSGIPSHPMAGQDKTL